MSPEIMSPEILFIKDKVTYFLNQTILNPVNAQKLVPPPEIAQTSVVKQEKEEAFLKAVQEMKGFTSTEVNSILRSILNGFATEARGWNHDAIKTSLTILPFIGLKKIYPRQIITENYMDAVVAILPSKPEVTAERGLQALIEAGMILFPYMSTTSNRKQIDTEVIPVLKQELEKRRSYTNKEVYEGLVSKIDDLSNALKTGLTKPIDIEPKDTTEIANKFRQLCGNSRYEHFSSEQFATLDSLVKEAIGDFGMNNMQITEMSGIGIYRITDSIRRLKKSGSIPDKNIHEDSIALQVQELLGKGLTAAQIAKALGEGITPAMVLNAKQRLKKRSLR